MMGLSMLGHDSQSIIVGVAMILVLEWVTQDACVTVPMHSDYYEEMKGDAHAEYLSKLIFPFREKRNLAIAMHGRCSKRVATLQ